MLEEHNVNDDLTTTVVVTDAGGGPDGSGGSSTPEREVVGVTVGAGGDPLIVILPLFCVGSLALGILLTGWLAPLAALTGIVPIMSVATGLTLLLGTVWALLLGLTIVAGISGIFAGFWLSLSALLLGLDHGWYAMPATATSSVEELFFICWAILIFMLLLPVLKLPLAYPLIVALVVAALVLSAIAASGTDPVEVFRAAGIVVLAFAAIGLYAFVSVGLAALDFNVSLPLGPIPGSHA
ncbi:hypothetical protein GHK86_03365 [Acidimicrobiaceae bacterium USS-CC1]|uniref:Yip1 domain-containing protein n=1 Tax=Acidiferrimicrobium australe TaxID=2664430 RepID=A0ABW9QR23_9ACTN|nr:hypothetical protein [Acidiferrimicrobium australe]